jgi:hypothetical protein
LRGPFFSAALNIAQAVFLGYAFFEQADQIGRKGTFTPHYAPSWGVYENRGTGFNLSPAHFQEPDLPTTVLIFIVR